MDFVGQMRERIYHIVVQESQDEAGDVVRTETVCGPYAAAVDMKETGSREDSKAGQKTNYTRTVFTIRRVPGTRVSTKDVIVFDGLRYSINAVIRAGKRGEYVDIEAYQIGEYNTSNL